MSPLAPINYDGYANKTHIYDALIKQVFDSIVEACQTVTPQKHGASALMTHASGDIIEARQEGPPLPPDSFNIILIITALTVSLAWILDDNPVTELGS